MQSLILEKNQLTQILDRMQQYGEQITQTSKRLVDQITIKIDELKGETEKKEFIAIEIANEVIAKLKLAIERVEANALP